MEFVHQSEKNGVTIFFVLYAASLISMTNHLPAEQHNLNALNGNPRCRFTLARCCPAALFCFDFWCAFSRN